MKREKVYCLILAVITTIVILGLMTKSIPTLKNEGIIVIALGYYTLILVVLISSLGIKKDKKSKEHWISLLVGIDGIIMITSFIIGCFGEIDKSIKNILLITFIITFILLGVLCGFWEKFEKDK